MPMNPELIKTHNQSMHKNHKIYKQKYPQAEHASWGARHTLWEGDRDPEQQRERENESETATENEADREIEREN